ncbi:Rieske 2Fe-2S domain-containing protein [Thermostichus vulcanus]|uniref:Rieske 2Fe-2S domain-containing protein n=1 Tax=Thermostichus vulcanus str. 'Rupite' TaxID=2813851 RepID=A0ABT0CAN6_THEVL|nr:Rieske 2Fe-2S domain-containing protein [Thermostichus vulcanus]MCJ2542833.1 Rieske 2Fe-2S domain-containing protein [Thermostichus vulcanus str. 'Rupite']
MQDVRRCGVNLDYWWPVAHERSFPARGLLGVRIGALELLVFRSPTGHYSVFEDACPHKRVRLSRFGEVVGSELMCGYHGWRFTAQGKCSLTPGFNGLAAKFCLKSYPVRQYGGWIWAFPGDPARTEERALPVIPPATDPRYHPIPMEGPVHCHFSYMTENATDLFHAQLHRSQQPWVNPVLLHLESDERTVRALYEVEAPRLLAALIGQRGKNRIQVTYEYPYFHLASEDGAFYLFVVYVPTSSTSIWVHSTFYFRHVFGIPWILAIAASGVGSGHLPSGVWAGSPRCGGGTKSL